MLTSTGMHECVKFEGGILGGRIGTRGEFDHIGVLFEDDGSAKYLPGTWGEGPHRIKPYLYVVHPCVEGEPWSAVYVLKGE